MIQLLTKFAATPSCEGGGFFGFPTWYKYLEVEYQASTKTCHIQFDLIDSSGKFQYMDLVLVTLSIIDILIRITALVALFFVMYGGIKYTTSQGSPEGTKAAQGTIQNALLGLIIAIVAAAFVSFIGGALQ